MANYDHIHDDNVVPLFEYILIWRCDPSRALGWIDGLKARQLRSVLGVAPALRKARANVGCRLL